RSRKVETEIARILGKPSWNDLVIEARLFVSNPAFRPTQKDIDEYKNKLASHLQELSNNRMKKIGAGFEAKKQAAKKTASKTIRSGR
ncbi:MAG: hypothetical protein P1P63_01280, partial [Treponemataceae bacterium]